MTYTKEQFLSDVKAEAVALREHATKEELGKLQLEDLMPQSETQCLYGQMTSECRSDRAVELITKCCRRFFKNSVYSALDNGGGMLGIRKYMNGERSEAPRTLNYISSIETYINIPDAKNENLISYLRGETDDLNL